MRRLVIALVVLAGLALGADRVGEEVAERQVASVVRDRENLQATPDVEFGGFPFLTQLLARKLSEVRVSLPAAATPAGDGTLRVRNVVATFFSVETSRDFRSATAARMRGKAVIPYSSISTLGPFEASYAGRGDGVGLVKLAPEGLPADLAVEVGVRVESGVVSFVGADGTTSVPLPDDVRPALEGLLGERYSLAGLPDGFGVTSLRVTRAGIVLVLSGRDVPLAR